MWSLRWAKKFLLQALAPFMILVTSPHSPARGGGGAVSRKFGVYTLKLQRNFSVVFILSLASEERVPKQLKQVSIVGRNPLTSYTPESVPRFVWGKKSPFFPPLA